VTWEWIAGVESVLKTGKVSRRSHDNLEAFWQELRWLTCKPEPVELDSPALNRTRGFDNTHCPDNKILSSCSLPLFPSKPYALKERQSSARKFRPDDFCCQAFSIPQSFAHASNHYPFERKNSRRRNITHLFVCKLTGMQRRCLPVTVCNASLWGLMKAFVGIRLLI